MAIFSKFLSVYLNNPNTNHAGLNKNCWCCFKEKAAFISLHQWVPRSSWMIGHQKPSLSLTIASTREHVCLPTPGVPQGPPTSPLHHRAVAVVTAPLPWEHLFWRRPWSWVTSHSTPQSLIRCATYTPQPDQLQDLEWVQTSGQSGECRPLMGRGSFRWSV